MQSTQHHTQPRQRLSNGQRDEVPPSVEELKARLTSLERRGRALRAAIDSPKPEEEWMRRGRQVLLKDLRQEYREVRAKLRQRISPVRRVS